MIPVPVLPRGSPGLQKKVCLHPKCNIYETRRQQGPPWVNYTSFQRSGFKLQRFKNCAMAKGDPLFFSLHIYSYRKKKIEIETG